MNTLCYILLPIIYISQFVIPLVSNTQERITISGRAIDKEHRPLPDVIVTLYTEPCSECIDNTFPANIALPDGVFFIDSLNNQKKKHWLFISEKVPFGFWSPLGSPPYERVSHLSEFKGKLINPSTNKRNIELGDVLVDIRFYKIRINLPSILGKNYNPNDESSKDIDFMLRDIKGKIIYSGNLSGEKIFDPTHTFLNLALTKGNWLVTLTMNHKINKKHSINLPINILDRVKSS